MKRGSTWISLAPVLLGLHHPAERHRVVLGHVRALMMMQSESARLPGNIVAAPRPNLTPRPGTLGAVSYAGLVLDRDDPQAAHQLLLDVVPLVVDGGAAEREDRRRWSSTSLPFGGACSTNVSSRVFLTSSAMRSIAQSSSQTSHCGGAGRAVEHLGQAVRVDVKLVDRRALGAEVALVDRAGRDCPRC